MLKAHVMTRKNALNDVLQFYNMIKQSAIEKLGLKQMKRDFYDPGGVIRKPEWNIDLWPGISLFLLHLQC